MRRVLLPFLFLPLTVLVVSNAHGREGTGAARGLSVEQTLLLALSDVPSERRLAAERLQQSASAEVLAFFDALRARLGLDEDERALRLSDLAVRGLRGEAPAPRSSVLHTELWVVHLEPAAQAALLAGLGLELAGGACVLDAQAAEALRAAVRDERRATVVCAPRLTMKDGGAASIALHERVAYVRSFRVVRARSTDVADPQVDALTDGFVARLQGTRTEDGRHVDLELRATWADVRSPLPVLRGRAGRGPAQVRIQVPQTELTLLQETMRIPDGGFALLQAPPRPGGERVLLLLHVVSQLHPPQPAPAALRPESPKK